MPVHHLEPRDIEILFATIEKSLKLGHLPEGVRFRGAVSAKVAAAAEIGISRQTGQDRLRRARELWDQDAKLPDGRRWRKVVSKREPDWSLWVDPRTKTDVSQATPGPGERQRLLDKIDRLQSELRGVLREKNYDEDLRTALFKLGAEKIHPPKWSIDIKPAKGGPGVPILFASDFQWGEVIQKDELMGVNEFNMEIARSRYRRLIERTIKLAFSHMVNPSYPGIFYLRGGDMVSGDIHQELRETNDLGSLPAVTDLVAEETTGIKKLADAFGKVRVISIPGNHGRQTMKPHSKKYAAHNYDTHSAFMLEQIFAAVGDDRVTFWTPPSGDALFPVYGWWFLATHGDRIGSRGGMGFIGPAATIARGMKRTRDYYAELGQIVHYILVGHFHTRMELEFGFANGSLPGASEYARDGRFTPHPPEQWLLFVHPDYGVTCRWPIQLSRPERLDTGVDHAEMFA